MCREFRLMITRPGVSSLKEVQFTSFNGIVKPNLLASAWSRQRKRRNSSPPRVPVKVLSRPQMIWSWDKKSLAIAANAVHTEHISEAHPHF